MSVDLRQCKPGDKLLTQHGTIMEYVGPNDSYVHTVFPHRVKYPNGEFGSRTDEGWVFRCNRPYVHTVFPHRVKYPNGEFGSRTDEGWVFRCNRRPEDEDIVEILK